MSISFAFFNDAGLTSPLVGNLQIQQASDGSTGPVDVNLFFGSVATGRKVQAATDPGIDPIILDVVDSAPGSGHEDTEIKLATTQIGLDSATPGASLNLGTELLSEVGNATSIWIRIEDATGVIGTSLELSIQMNNVIEVDV